MGGSNIKIMSKCESAWKSAKIPFHITYKKIKKSFHCFFRLGQGAKALSKAIDSGDTDLIYHVILNLQEEHSTADFHMIMRGVKLGAR